MSPKEILYKVSKRLGLFRLAGLATRRQLRILCYHGFTIEDEDAFSGKLFISGPTFEKRLQWLADAGIPVLPLEEAVATLRKGLQPPYATAITIDDGFYSVFAKAMPALAKRRFPATLYVSSYYFDKQTPIFRLVVRYMFWKTDRPAIDIRGLLPGDESRPELNPRGPGASEWMWKLIAHSETRLSEPERCELARELGRRTGVGYEGIARSRMLSLITDEEMRELLENGVDIQLHTHRHRFPVDEEVAARELEENQRALARVRGGRLRHFCYPSGDWSMSHWKWLEDAGVETAVTCQRGFNTAETPRFALRRFLDGESVSQIEFEAEIWGFSEILRRLRRRLTGAEERPTLD